MTLDSDRLVTALLSAHEDAGAQLIDFAGWNMPVRYTSDRIEHEAVRTAAGIFDLSHMAQIFVSGDNSAAGLDHCFISAIAALNVGRAKYSMITNEAGGILDDLIVYRLAETAFLVVANASNREIVVAEVTKRCAQIDPEIVVEDRTLERAIIAVQGPHSAAILRSAGLTDATEIKYYTVTTGKFEGADLLIARTGYTGEDGFEIYLPAQAAQRVWKRLLELGVEFGLIPCGLACRDTLRLEAGMPLYGHELTRELAPCDVGMARVAKLENDFIGRDALAAREAKFALIALTGQGRRAARAGSDVRFNGEQVGIVTSGVLSPTLGHPIALALVNLPVPPVGTELEIEVRGKIMPMTVVPSPFYSRTK